MSIGRLFCSALIGAACIGLPSPAFAFDARHHADYPVATYSASSYSLGSRSLSTVRTVGAPITTQARTKVLYIVPVIPTLLGIRPAPVGQPVIYVIDQPGEQEARRSSHSRDVVANSPEPPENGPRILRLEP